MLEHCVGTIADLRYGLIELFRRNADDFEPIAKLMILVPGETPTGPSFGGSRIDRRREELGLKPAP
jgi:hypothetical protein